MSVVPEAHLSIPVCNSLVFFDLETTGIPAYHPPRITELSFCAVERTQFIDSNPGVIPRVNNRINLCVYPSRLVDPVATTKTKLDNYNLEHQGRFDEDVFNIIFAFLNRLKRPVCLIAHNGFQFDFPILMAEISKLGKKLPDGILCADSLIIFRKLQQSPMMAIDNETPLVSGTDEEQLNLPNPFQLVNEKTPEKRKIDKEENVRSHQSCKKRLTFRLEDVYERCYGVKPKMAHEAEADVQALLLSAIATPAEFLKAVDSNAIPFTSVKKCW